MTLRAQLSRVKDKLPTSMRSCVVYSIPCSCEKVYIGETTRRLEQRISKHQDACRKGEEKKSVVAEHAWKEHHPIRWQETSVINRASRFGELRVKEALHIHLTPGDQCFNRDVGLGFHSQGFVREATPTTISLIGKGFSPFFSMNELHGFFILSRSEPVMHHALCHLSKPL